MPLPAIDLRSVRARLDPAALVEKRVVMDVEAMGLRMSDQGLALVLPSKLQLEGIAPERLHLRVASVGLVEFRPVVGSTGRLRLEAVSVRLGFLPLPVSLVHFFVSRLAEPGLHAGEGNEVEIDIRELILDRVPGVTLPPLKAVRAEAGVLDLQF